MTAPTLHDNRIESMRGNVMLAVDRDIRRRGRRARSTIGLAAAGVVMVGGLGGYAALTAEHQSPESSSISAGATAEKAPGTGIPGVAGDDTGATADDRARTSTEQLRQVVTTGSISVTVDEPRAVAARVTTYVEGIGGRVDNRSESGNGKEASATLEVRVPAAKVSATIAELEDLGTVENVSLQNDDVTSVAQDLDARIDALQISVDRLSSILESADSSREVIAAESALTTRQEQLEQLQSQRRSIAAEVELSTITIDLAQEEAVGSVEPGGFSGGLRDGWNGLVEAVNAVVSLAGRVLPWAVVAVVLLGCVRLATRLVTRRRTRD